MGITTSKSENLTTDDSNKGSGREKKNYEVVSRNEEGVVFNIVAGTSVTISQNNINFSSSMQEPGKLSWRAKRARRIAARFEKGKHLRKMEANVKKSGGKRVTFKRDVEQKMEVKVKMEQSKHVKTESSELMN
ncbi:hypothetical protein CRE_07902 [Caenorhabditis remanei]|uniref:Uncharacterized protein n=1 Tax=Caenorhabditis remanei TaxID=31234 RepID=E3NN15_CAERE|nr:hypothetical protein CRE_07902 [Caenorhabditis remanei]